MMKEVVREERVEELSLQSGCHLFFYKSNVIFSKLYLWCVIP